MFPCPVSVGGVGVAVSLCVVVGVVAGISLLLVCEVLSAVMVIDRSVIAVWWCVLLVAVCVCACVVDVGCRVSLLLPCRGGWCRVQLCVGSVVGCCCCWLVLV